MPLPVRPPLLLAQQALAQAEPLADTAGMWFLVACTAAVAVCTAALAASTATGARRRGLRWPTALLAGAVFPVTWAIWYAVGRRASAAVDRPRLAHRLDATCCRT